MPNGSQYQTVQTGYAGPWVDQVLQALGAPTTDSNRAALRAWAASEGTLTSNNPLAISTAYPGATTCIAQCGSKSPIYAYSSIQQGAANNAQFILGGYPTVVQAFRNDAGLQSIWQAVNSSAWCAGCGTPGTNCPPGTYPCALLEAAGGKGGGSGGAPAAPAAAGGSTPGQSSGFNPNAAAFSLPVLGTVLNAGQELKIKGWFLMIAGGAVAVIGLGVVLATLGLQSKAGRSAAEVVPGGVALKAAAGQGTTTQRSRAQDRAETAARRQEDRMQLAQERGSQQRATEAMRETRSQPLTGGGRRRQPSERRRAINTTPNTVDREGVPF